MDLALDVTSIGLNSIYSALQRISIHKLIYFLTKITTDPHERESVKVLTKVSCEASWLKLQPDCAS
jgi:hypothetical protein